MTKLYSNQTVTREWHKVSCNQIGKENPTCKCAEHNHHVGAYRVACFVGLVPERRTRNAE